MNVYLVTSGSHSEYQIRAICSTPEIADKVAAKLCPNDNHPKGCDCWCEINPVREWTIDEVVK